MFRDMVTEPERAASYRRDGRWDSTTLSGRLEAVAAAGPAHAAVIDRDGKAVHTYAELERDVSLFALWLGRPGGRPGRRRVDPAAQLVRVRGDRSWRPNG